MGFPRSQPPTDRGKWAHVMRLLLGVSRFQLKLKISSRPKEIYLLQIAPELQEVLEDSRQKWL